MSTRLQQALSLHAFIFFIALPHLDTAAASRLGRFALQLEMSAEEPPLEQLHFREAPAFRNGDNCSPPPFNAFSNAAHDLCHSGLVHVAMTLDVAYIRGSIAAILSIMQHAECPENIAFHFLATYSLPMLAHTINSVFPDLKFKLYHFNAAIVKDKISRSVRKALEQPLNYARMYLPDILPTCVKRSIYLDSDLVVIDDIMELWSTDLGSHAVGAPEYCHTNFSGYFTDSFWSDPSLCGVFEGRNPCYFNTGVMVINLEMWRFWGYTRILEKWMELQREVRIYELGSLPPFLLVFAGNVQPIAHRWNQHGLGGDNVSGRCRRLHPGAVSLLHWSGKGKPWRRLDSRRPCSLDSLWAPYDLAAFSANGRDYYLAA